MWMINPKLLCSKHLLGEHGEIHKHKHNFVKGHSIDGRKGQIDPIAMKRRHDELAEEMLRRQYNHKSPYSMPDLSGYDLSEHGIDVSESLEELKRRCPECSKRIEDENLLVRFDV
jgi:hypothetical protein